MCVCVMYLYIVYPYMCVLVSALIYTRGQGIRCLAWPTTLSLIPLGQKLSFLLPHWPDSKP